MSSADRLGGRGRAVLLTCGFIVFVMLRLVAWSNVQVLEDHDSVSYLRAAEAFVSRDALDLARLSPDLTPGFPFATALLSTLVGSTETAARLASLLMACLMYWSVIGVARWLRADDKLVLVSALGFLAFNPTLVGLGYSVLSEPMYIGLVYLGLLIFLKPRVRTWRDGALLGLVVGASFLTRIEGMLFVAVYPMLASVEAATAPASTRRWRSLAAWSVALVLGFAVLAVPQIVWVSERLGRPAFNGRQVWMSIMSASGDASYEQRIYGLDHDPRQVNLEYLQQHPGALQQQPGGTLDLPNLIRIVVFNVDELSREKLGLLFAPVMLALIGLGALGLARRGEGRRLALLSVWIASTIVAPLLYNVADRHIAVIMPALLLLAGCGVATLSGLLARRFERWATPVALGVAGLAVAGLALPLYRATIDLPTRGDYDPQEVAAIARILREDTEARGQVRPTICARADYLPYYAGAIRLPLPFTDSSGLLGYLQANGADYLFLEHALASTFPLTAEFEERGALPGPVGEHLVEIDRRTTAFNGDLVLYRVRP